jgi:hypothetical protein
LKYILLYIILFACLTHASAQIKISGTVYDSTKRNLIESVQIVCTCGTMSFSDSTGSYSIFASEKDSVFFFFRNKPTQMFAVSEIKDREAFDIALHIYVPGKYKQLKEIIIYGKNRTQDSIENRLQYDKVFRFDDGGLELNNAAPESGIGVGLDIESLINMFRFRRNRSMLRFQERLIKEEQDRYIDYRFNENIIEKLTSIEKGEKMRRFMEKYRPEYEWLTTVLDMELYMYIQTAAHTFIHTVPVGKPKQ